MTSQYYESHKEELEAIAEAYECSDNPYLLYRAECIRELLSWEALKLE